jgi:hypothetical protein
MSRESVRFGILGCADIARKNIRAIERSSSCRLVAVASRSKEKAEAFIEECCNAYKDTVTAYGSYQELLEVRCGSNEGCILWVKPVLYTHRSLRRPTSHLLLYLPLRHSVATRANV